MDAQDHSRDHVLGDPSSEVGSQHAPEPKQNATQIDNPGQSENLIFNESEGWKLLFQMQQKSLMELIKTIKEPSYNDTRLTLPEFNPEHTDCDANSWCSTVDLCMQERPLSGSNLIIVMSRALKGPAASWLAQTSFAGITWPQLKDLFLARFDSVETPAATLFKILNDTPKEGECLSSYANRIMGSLMNRWASLSTEQIAIALTLAHTAKIEPRLQRIAFTTEIDSRNKLRQELMAFGFRKRGAPAQDKPVSFIDVKRPRLDQSRRCYNCGRPGHRALECRGTNSRDNINRPLPGLVPVPSSSVQHYKEPESVKKNTTATCYYCGEPGHIATRCPKKEAKSADAKSEQRVDVCTMKPATDYLLNSGEKFSFCFDSGAECSLITESVIQHFSGRRIHNVVKLLGLGKVSINSHTQILAIVGIQSFTVELLFHVVPDNSLSCEIMIGRDLISLGFSVEICHNYLIVRRTKLVSVCDIGSKIKNFDNINTDIPSENRDALHLLLAEYSEYFVEGTPTGRISSGQLEIKLVDPNRTVQRRPYRLSPAERQIVRDKVKELFEAGVIRESASPFSSPILLVKKRDGTDRLCVDYRELNSNTIPDRYPLPLISDQIQRLVGANYFTSLDMASGYHQIPIETNSIERTAFVTSDGQYEYLAMPFGLRNAPSVYQRAINKALGELTESFAVVYLDDVIIPSKTTEEGFERLSLVLRALSRAGFSLNLGKCAFLKTRVDFLGYEVSAGEIRPNPRKIRALVELTPPQNVTQLRQFIGLASYFRQFVPSFSLLMAPLYRLTSGKGKISWTPEYEKIRKSVISVLTNKPVLTIFDPDQSIELHTDASTEGYGAILLQKIDGKMRVVEYYSRRTSSAESKYHSYELETLAVVNSIKHFRHYLYGRKFLVVTDCNAVKASKSKIDLTPRVHRWWCFLQTFDFDIEYRKGRQMGHVDFLSRNPLPSPENFCKVEQKRVHLTEISDNWLQAEQLRDTEITSILKELEENSLDKDLAKTYEVRRGILYRKIERNNRSIWLPIVPRAFQWAVINHVHESIMHLGWQKTLEKVYCHYWFPNMNKYVRKFVENCITCRISKSHSGRVQAELHPIPKATIPWHTIHIDATGKLSGKNKIKEYVFVSIDAFTKYVVLHRAQNIDTISALKALKQCISLFGAPTRLIADQGRCFASTEFREFCNANNIILHLIATGTSRANGQVERVMSTLKNMLTAVETDSNKSWQDALPDIQLALNCTMNRVTRASPLELLIGKVARPLNLMTLDTDDNIEINLHDIREQAARAITVSASTEKARFDKTKARINRYTVGDFVLIENHERNQTKLDPKFRGPFKIVDLLDGDRYLLKDLNSNRTYKYAHERLRAMPECYVPSELSSGLSQQAEMSECTDNGADSETEQERSHEDV